MPPGLGSSGVKGGVGVSGMRTLPQGSPGICHPRGSRAAEVSAWAGAVLWLVDGGRVLARYFYWEVAKRGRLFGCNSWVRLLSRPGKGCAKMVHDVSSVAAHA